ncbi:hypothetical protein BKA70DRAFT_1149960 [Coprinopsis sp. MPI-PUGE-AT-0042]|nr:hypothetical protein BKA70DRAFT_1149960 [Coprinopsis sp. MPI-PUGE-AT-0042]
MGAQISFLDGPHASSSLDHMPGYFEPSPDHDNKTQVVSILEGTNNSNISGGTFNAAGRDVMTTTVNNIVINLVDNTPLQDTAILDWLSPNNYRMMQMANLEKAVTGTCHWFLISNLFMQWLASCGGILWGIGMPGAGKTILASIVIEYLQKYARAHGPRIALVFAYCRYTEPVPVQQILAALVRQLLERYPFLYPLVKPVYDEHHREMTKPSKAQLLELLSEICQVFDVLFCALDGLDEAAPDTQFDLVNALSSVKANFFITSRPLEPLQSLRRDAQFFKIVAQDEDIELLIWEKLTHDARFSMPLNAQEYSEWQSQIVSKVTAAAGGMFLHAALQVETLRHATSLRNVLDSLDGFPSTINDMYSATLERIIAQPGTKPQLARQILTWLAYARRGLSVDDIRYALAIPLTNPLPPNEDIVDPLLLVDEHVLLSVCCGLVIVDKPAYGTPSLRLIHFTAVDFLKTIISSAEAHLVLALTCIRRIISVDTSRSAEPFPISKYQRYPLLHYAVDLWGEHGSHCVGPDGSTMRRFLREVAHIFARRCWIPSAYSQPIFPWTALCTVIWRIPAVLAPLLAMNDPCVTQVVADQANSSTPDFLDSSTPLTLAVKGPDTQVLPVLLALPNINVKAFTHRGTALMIAAEMGKVEAMKVLLDDPRVDVNIHQRVTEISTWRGMTALMLAAKNHKVETAELLLSFPATKADLATEDGTTALMLAASKGCEGITRLLLCHTDVDVNRAKLSEASQPPKHQS